MSRREKKKMSKKTKGIIGGVGAVCILAVAGLLWIQQQQSKASATKVPYQSENVTEGGS